MKFEDKLLKLLNKALEQGIDFDFKEFRLSTKDNKYTDEDLYIIKNNGRFYYIDAMNHYEMKGEED